MLQLKEISDRRQEMRQKFNPLYSVALRPEQDSKELE